MEFQMGQFKVVTSGGNSVVVTADRLMVEKGLVVLVGQDNRSAAAFYRPKAVYPVVAEVQSIAQTLAPLQAKG